MGTARGQITDAQAKKSRADGSWLSESLGRGRGSLVIKGGAWYFRHTTASGKREIIPIGLYPTTSARLARERAGDLASQAREVLGGDLKADAARQESERLEAEAAAKLAAERLAKHTFSAMLTLYTDHLEHQGKEASAREVRSLFRRNIEEGVPDLAALPACNVTSDHIAGLLRRIARDQKRGRTAAKLRAYLMAAFRLAMQAKYLPDAPADLIAFGVTANPVDAVPPLNEYNRAREHALTQADLSALWEYLRDDESLAGRALSLVLLSGGQRVRQLLRLELKHVDLDAGTITLFDTKGRRSTPRVHIVPLAADGLQLVDTLVKRAKELESHWLFTSEGDAPITAETVSAYASKVAAMLKADDKISEPFLGSDLRRTIETRLAARGVSKDVRAQLQSHGLGGVQARHYDRHDYMDEKRRAVELVESLLGGTSEEATKVTPLRARSGRKQRRQ